MPAIRAKFTQDDHLATYLKNTDNRDLAEATTTDTFRGTGMSLNNISISSIILLKPS